MLCIHCEDHVHLVLSDLLTSETRKTQISWPLYSQYELKVMLDGMVDDCEVKDKTGMREFRAATMRWAKRLKCRDGKRLKGHQNLPASSGVVAGDLRMSNWWGFVEGKSEMCNFFIYGTLGAFVYPLYGCKFVKYHTEPSRTLQRFKDPEWKGEFQIPTNV